MIQPKLERILPRVQKPARYTGGEWNAVDKSGQAVDLRFALCFPDTYEIGMSNLGVRILYGVMNRLEGVWCQRAFAPWGDMEEEMRRHGIPLWALESGQPIRDFEWIGFSLGYELSYTNVLNMLDLAGLPVLAAERGEDAPLVVAGGTCALNPEPMSPFIDIFSLGEGEEVTVEMIQLYREGRQQGWSKGEYLRRAARIPGLYVPSLYQVAYGPDGLPGRAVPQEGAPERVVKRVVQDLNRSHYPAETIVPSTEIVHDRVMLELFRGCIRGCRFCQAGFVYRPVRSKDREVLAAQGVDACRSSGYQEITLSSLSTSDYPGLTGLCDDLLDYCQPRGINLSLPSLRADNFSMELMQRLQRTRKSGLTFAPEAGTQRLRDAINKNLTEEDLFQSCRTAFSGGWSGVKLYFMLGLPTETDEDVLGIAKLAQQVYQIWRESTPNPSRGVRITVSTSCFVPKPHTPFQWEPQVTREEYLRRVKLLRGAIRCKSITYNWHDADTAYLEAALSRGDRRLGAVIHQAWRTGARLDAWSEYFSLERWLDAFSACGLDPDFYACRPRGLDEVLPWEIADIGVHDWFFKVERERAFQSQASPDCRRQCGGCGANRMYPGGVCHG